MITQAPYGIIYLTSRVFEGEVVKRYIGQHKVHGGIVEDGYLGSGRLISHAIRKYGRKVFVREVLEVCYSRREMDLAEIKWIECYNAVSSADFYNLVDGGGSNNGVKLKKSVFQYTREGVFVRAHDSIAAAAREAGCADAQMTHACNNLTRTAKGFQWRFDRLDSYPSLSPRERRVSCYDLKGNWIRDFKTCIAAAKSIRERRSSNIVACVKGLKKSAGGFQWRYAEEGLTSISRRVAGTSCKEVFQFSKKGEFLARHVSLTVAAEAVRGSTANISACCQGRRFSTAGFRWSLSESTLNE